MSEQAKLVAKYLEVQKKANELDFDMGVVDQAGRIGFFIAGANRDESADFFDTLRECECFLNGYQKSEESLK